MDIKELTEIFGQHRILLLRGDINDKMQEILYTAIEVLDLKNHDPITLRIDSCGGNVTMSKLISDSIQFANSKVQGIVTGIAFSAAFNILQACDTRQAYPSALFIFHGTKIRSYPPTDHPDFESEFEHTKSEAEARLKMISRRSGQSLTKVRLWSRNETRFTAKEALKFGFIDKILQPPIKK